MISQQDKIDFYNVLYFSSEHQCFKQKAIWRAYRDFNRTLRFNDLKGNSDFLLSIKKLWEKELIKIIEEVCNQLFLNANEFDEWHKEKTISLQEISINNFKLSVGQSQKWINMTLKYLLLFGDEKISNISKNSFFFHIPIDNIIQERIFKRFKIEMFKCSWSRIENYDSYLNYQKQIRSKTKPESAFEFEFKLFNNEIFQQ